MLKYNKQQCYFSFLYTIIEFIKIFSFASSITPLYTVGLQIKVKHHRDIAIWYVASLD